MVIEHLLIDSRKILFPKNSLFFAIKGTSHNGHDFIQYLYEQGVRNFIIDETLSYMSYPKANFILVTNTIFALQTLTTHHRNQFTPTVIGITGSNGKTIIKEWLYQLLSPDYLINRSPKSYNSQVGVPLSVWQQKEEHTLAIYEAGISLMGEMENLEGIIRPDIGIISNIGSAHSEGFRDDKSKTLEKLKLFKHASYLIYRQDYPIIEHCIQTIKQTHPHSYTFKTLTWATNNSPTNNPDLFIHSIQKFEKATKIQARFQQEKIHFSINIPFTDDASIENAIHCVLLMLHLKYTSAIIQKRILHLSSVAMRLVLKAGNNNCSIINDAYNADLNALVIALDFLDQQNQHAKKSVVLSDILESGQKATSLYGKVAHLIEQKKVSRFIGIGPKISQQQHLFKNIAHSFFPNTAAFLANPPFFKEETILVKGARSFAFEKIIQLLEEKAHSTVLEINLNAIAHNLKVYRQLIAPSTKLMVMVKAFSYGSGSFEIANLLQFNKVDYLAVAYTDEGVALRKSGISVPIMVMNPEPDSFANLLKYQLEPEIYSLAHLQKINTFLLEQAISTPLAIHLKIDTGMHRLGFEKKDLFTLIKILKNNPCFKVVSILSHLAASDESQHDPFSQQQIYLFNEIYKELKTHFSTPIWRHILNSTGIIRFANDPNAQLDMVRLGLGLYGIDTTNILQQKLLDVSCLKTYISQIKQVSPSETVGYARMGKMKQLSSIATVSIGYGDGLPRCLSNGKGKMLVRGQLAPIIGNVCMDMTMLDVSAIKDVQEGDEVIVFGKGIPIQKVATWANTIPYEIMTGVSARVKRVYYQE